MTFGGRPFTPDFGNGVSRVAWMLSSRTAVLCMVCHVIRDIPTYFGGSVRTGMSDEVVGPPETDFGGDGWRKSGQQ